MSSFPPFTRYRFMSLKTLSFLTALVLSQEALSQINFNVGTPTRSRETVTIRDLNWMNDNFLQEQRRVADDYVRAHLGRQLHQKRSDLELLSRLVAEHKLENADKKTLQALGVALGDVFLNEHKKLRWQVYEDTAGSSHAICLAETEHCIFPITMISRRVEAGFSPDVEALYNETLKNMKAHFPKLPYSRDTE